MKHKYEVRWYEFNLTQRMYRKFFTEIGAVVFKWYLERFCDAYAKIYEIE